MVLYKTESFLSQIEFEQITEKTMGWGMYILESPFRIAQLQSICSCIHGAHDKGHH